jgi:hypothetical protein
MMNCFYSPWKSGLDPTPVHVQSGVDKLALGEAFLRVLRAFLVSSIPTLLYVHISSLDDRRYVILAIECVLTEKTTVEQGQIPDDI